MNNKVNLASMYSYQCYCQNPRELTDKTISAAKYYIGTPDGMFFTSNEFPENVVKAQKAYITLNTIIGGDTAEYDRFSEGKQQLPDLITMEGIAKCIELFEVLYSYGLKQKGNITFNTVRACRQSEIFESTSFVVPLTSTTKLSIQEIMKLGYGDKNNLAICQYHFNSNSVIFDLEKLEQNYLKPNEREVLLLPGNKLETKCIGYSDSFYGKDHKPALMFDVYVSQAKIPATTKSRDSLERIVFNDQYLSKIQDFFVALNNDSQFPTPPTCYTSWKHSLKELLFLHLSII